MLQQADYQHILALGSDVLTCGTMDDLQDTAMRRVAKLLPTESMIFLNGAPPDWQPEEMHTQGFDPEFPYDFLGLSDIDPGVPLIVQNWLSRKSQILNSSQVMPVGAEADFLLYRRVLKPRKLRHTLAFSMAIGDDSYGVMVLFRSEHAGQYTAHEMAMAKVFLPFLKGAMDRICATEQKLRLTSLLDHVSQDLSYKALMVFDHKLKFVSALPSPAEAIKDIIQDITRPPDQKSIITPDLRPICQNFLASGSKPRITLSLGYTDRAEQYFQIPVELRKEPVNGNIGIALRVGFADRQTNIQSRLNLCGLTRQENIIAEQLSCGLKNAEIARNLSISPSTVANHVSSILAKAEIPNRSQLMSTLGTQSQIANLPITNREKQVLLVKLSGLSTKAIADQLNISQATVQNHLRIIYRKLGVSGFRGVIHHLNIKSRN